MPSAAPDDGTPDRTALARLIGAEAIARFDGDLRDLGYDGGDLAIAVSGGPDSTALLLLAVAASARPGRVVAATVDHGLRPGSAAEAEQVARLCRRLGVRHTTLAVTVARTRGGPQAAARAARYAALSEWCPARRLLTGHHRDDVAETLLMRLARGSGVRGLARMAPRSRLGGGGGGSGAMLLRPLLGWSRAELSAVCAQAGVATVDDPSNADDRYDRTAARSLLRDTPWLDPGQLARSSANLAAAEAALEWSAERLWMESAIVQLDEAAIELRAAGLPHEIKRRLVDRIIRRMAGDDPDRRIETLIARLDAGEPGMIADIEAVPGPTWIFRRAPPRRTA